MTQDDDLKLFVSITNKIERDYVRPEDDPWLESPFRWILTQPSRTRGAIGERLIRQWASEIGVDCKPPTNTGHDCQLNGEKIEVKFSTLWKSGGFKFQQIRDQDYERVALLGMEPDRVRLWFAPKEKLRKEASGQHTGAAGVDTKWFSFPASSPPTWLSKYGGTLDEARIALEKGSIH